MEIDPAIVMAILAFCGIGVTGITEMVKRLLKASGILAYVISLVVSALATAFVLYQSAQFTVLWFIIYTIIVFLEANGIYKVIKK